MVTISNWLLDEMRIDEWWSEIKIEALTAICISTVAL